MAVLVDGAILQFKGYCGPGHTGVSGHDKIQLIPFFALTAWTESPIARVSWARPGFFSDPLRQEPQL